MPTIACKRWDVVLVPFPFTDLSSTKKRPAVIVSPDDYNAAAGDIVIAFVTSRSSLTHRPGDCPIRLWQEAGLLKPSTLRMKFATVDAGIVLKKLGTMAEADRSAVRELLRSFFAGP
jgi:mRNA interferase MazF